MCRNILTHDEVEQRQRRHIPLESKQTRGLLPMLFQCWPIVFDAGPTLKQHWVKASGLLGKHCLIEKLAVAVHIFVSSLSLQRRVWVCHIDYHIMCRYFSWFCDVYFNRKADNIIISLVISHMIFAFNFQNYHRSYCVSRLTDRDATLWRMENKVRSVLTQANNYQKVFLAQFSLYICAQR